MSNVEKVTLQSLDAKRFGHFLCYPKYTPEELRNRVEELRRLGVTAIAFEGQRHIGDLRVLGKGHVGIVVKAFQNHESIALKIRRIDADRRSMQHEMRMLQIANKANAGPRFLDASKNFLLMEYVKGELLPEWLESHCVKDHREEVRHVLRLTLEQAWRLDEAGLDHGELSNAPRHIIVRANSEPCLVDFETASTSRRVSNVTSLGQYLLLAGATADLVRGVHSDIDEHRLVRALRNYKRERNRENFLSVLVDSKIQRASMKTRA